MASVNDVPGGFNLPGVVFSTHAYSSSSAGAGDLSGGTLMIVNNSGGTPGTLTSRTAAQMITDSNLTMGQVWWLLVVNGQGSGTLTLAGASGVTVSGTATVAPITARLYICQVTGVGANAAITMVGQTWSFTATALAFGA